MTDSVKPGAIVRLKANIYHGPQLFHPFPEQAQRLIVGQGETGSVQEVQGDRYLILWDNNVATESFGHEFTVLSEGGGGKINRDDPPNISVFARMTRIAWKCMKRRKTRSK